MAKDSTARGPIAPVYRIEERGEPTQIGLIQALGQDRRELTQDPERLCGLCEGLPHVLQDARPGGFLGRAVPHQLPELDLPPRIADWTEDHVLIYLTQRAADSLGDLVLGEQSIERYLAGSQPSESIDSAQRASRYPACAAAAMAGNPAGACAQGEQPKFLARLDEDERLLSAEDAERIALLEAFAMLIANTDRHFGNVTLFDRYEGPFELAPAYDLLPMLFAPQL